MHPTVEEQLRALRGVVDHVAAEQGLSTVGAQALANVALQLRRLEHSYSARLAFLLQDNLASAALLEQLEGTWVELAQTVMGNGGASMAPSEDQAHQTNKALRGLLARAVHELAADDAGDAARARIAAHLRRRVALDPSLNRPRTAMPNPEP